jgi:tRNA(Ile2) C34 agmatinyltransferase TiaS
MLRRVETGPDGREYEVRPIAAARAVKVYRCPGCDHQIRSGTAHVVVWPAELRRGAAQTEIDDRRHWHTPCWANRATRGPTRKWS